MFHSFSTRFARSNSRSFLVFFLLFSGCSANYYIKDNISEGQIIETALIRKPSLSKTWGILPRYDDFLEGYIVGGMNYGNGKPAQGVIVSVRTQKGDDHPGFESGVTDSSGVYKVHFSLPVRWRRVDETCVIAADPEWKMITPNTRFRIYFDRRNGILLYSSTQLWHTVHHIKEPSADAPPPPPPKPAKKSDDAFGDFGGDFGFGD